MKRVLLFAGSLVLAGQAAAHGQVQGLGNFFGGVVHPLIEPTHLISLIALGLVLGQRGLKQTDPAALCFVAASAAGLAVAGFGWTPDTDLALLAVATLAGLLVATSAQLPRSVYALAATAFGLGIGLASSPGAVPAGALIACLLGAGFGANLWLLNVVALVGQMKRPWLLILVRVMGSWVSASALLVLALWISGRHEPMKPVPAGPGHAAAPFETRP